MENAVKITTNNTRNESYFGAILEDGSLYIWGYNANQQEGSLSPIKILDNVADVTISENGTWAAIMKNGELYMWGGNERWQIGNGKSGETSVLTPQKVVFYE